MEQILAKEGEVNSKYPFKVTRDYKYGHEHKQETKNFEKLSSALVCRDNWMNDRLSTRVMLCSVLDEWTKPAEQRYAERHDSSAVRYVGDSCGNK